MPKKPYMEWIRQLMCCNCLENYKDRCGHHLNTAANSGMAEKAQAEGNTVPMCDKCHRSELHQHGKETFWGSARPEILGYALKFMYEDDKPIPECNATVVEWRIREGI